MSIHFRIGKVAAVLGAARDSQEGFLKRRGWVRLVERADVWICLHHVGELVHDVYLFRFALERELMREYHRRKSAAAREKAIHHNEAWLDANQVGGATS